MGLPNVDVLRESQLSDSVLEDADLVDRAIDGGFPTLVFPGRLEREFAAHVADKRVQILTLFGLCSAGVVLGQLMADWFLLPDVFPRALALRLGGYLLPVCIGLWILQRWRWMAVWEWMVAAAGVWAGAIMASLLWMSRSQLAFTTVVEFNIIVVFVCAFARFWPAVLMCAGIVCLHTMVMFNVHDFTGVLVVNTSVLLGATILFCLYANYKLEHDERMGYLQDRREQIFDAQLQGAHDLLAHQATTDPLTEVANRRYFEAYVQDYWRRALELHQPISLILLDIDHFKRFNDHHGHQAGDRCLVTVTQAVQGCLRRTGDLVGRLGGEEFAVVMPEVNEAVALAVAQRVRSAVEARAVPHATSPTADVVTVSVGVVTLWPSEGVANSAQALYAQADDALYEAKHAGRNRVMVARQELQP
jgi:diguanylate cyclase (GGDEF)-like protein